ncbi:MAG: hypothetical protein J2P41_04005 [Blastocatellia bacterium]|nr:hypothetical protein [Blastocatellia bacterium]
MNKFSFILAAAVSVAALLAPAASAQTINLLGAGSSAMWQSAALGAFGLAGAGAGHYTVGGNCADGTPVARIIDSRDPSISPEGGNIWVVWSADQSQVWAYISVDSTVGNRAFFAVPRATVALGCTEGVPAGQNRIVAALWKDGSADSALPPAVAAALSPDASASVTTAFTDIRPEDAKFAEDFTFGIYGTTPIFSAFSSAKATPIEFNIMGTDPYTGLPVPDFTTIPVGAAPIVFILNRTAPNSLGTNLQAATAASIFSGANCAGMTALLREPLSGTMNTTEFTVFAAGGRPFPQQEQGITSNPVNQPCTGGTGVRLRGIGTGEIVSGVHNIANSIGYAFFGYGNFASIAGSSSWGYLTLDGVDPIKSAYTDGILPTCAAPCPVPAGTSFPHLRDGSYSSWSVLRTVTDNDGLAATNAIVSAIQSNINSSVPDFIPYNELTLYRSHFAQSGKPAANPAPVGPGESGGDVGGCIRPLTDPFPGVLECRQ